MMTVSSGFRKDLPENLIEETAKLQEALKPLGYRIRGFRDNKKSLSRLILYLDFDSSIIAGDDNSKHQQINC